jgi:hypothetical protein
VAGLNNKILADQLPANEREPDKPCSIWMKCRCGRLTSKRNLWQRDMKKFLIVAAAGLTAMGLAAPASAADLAARPYTKAPSADCRPDL